MYLCVLDQAKVAGVGRLSAPEVKERSRVCIHSVTWPLPL